MRTGLATVALVLGFCGSAQASAEPRGCGGSPEPGVSNPPLACSKTFTATKVPRRFKALGRDWRGYASQWVAGGPEESPFGPSVFLTGVRKSCVNYGRRGSLRVSEQYCNGPLVITVRSVGAPQPVTFYWERTR